MMECVRGAEGVGGKLALSMHGLNIFWLDLAFLVCHAFSDGICGFLTCSPYSKCWSLFFFVYFKILVSILKFLSLFLKFLYSSSKNFWGFKFIHMLRILSWSDLQKVWAHVPRHNWTLAGTFGHFVTKLASKWEIYFQTWTIFI